MRRAAFLLGFLLLASSAAAQFNTIWGVTTGQFNLWGLSIPQPTVNGTVLTYNLGTLSWAAGGGGSAFVTPTTIVIPNSTAQTDLLINPAVKTSGNLIDAQVGGVSKFSVTSAGVTSIYQYSTYQVGLTSMSTAGVWARHNSASLVVTDINVDSGTSGISQVKKQIGGQSDWQFGWEATTTGNVTLDTFDTGLARSAAGILKVTNGSTGLGSLIAAYRSTALGGNVNSATTITPTGSVFHVTGVTAIATINLPFVGFVGAITIIPDGIFTTTTAGNIALVSTTVVSKALIMTYDGTKWYPSY